MQFRFGHAASLNSASGTLKHALISAEEMFMLNSRSLRLFGLIHLCQFFELDTLEVVKHRATDIDRVSAHF
jgi:hypothetical protein